MGPAAAHVGAFGAPRARGAGRGASLGATVARRACGPRLLEPVGSCRQGRRRRRFGVCLGRCRRSGSTPRRPRAMRSPRRSGRSAASRWAWARPPQRTASRSRWCAAGSGGSSPRACAGSIAPRGSQWASAASWATSGSSTRACGPPRGSWISRRSASDRAARCARMRRRSGAQLRSSGHPCWAVARCRRARAPMRWRPSARPVTPRRCSRPWRAPRSRCAVRGSACRGWACARSAISPATAGAPAGISRLRSPNSNGRARARRT